MGTNPRSRDAGSRVVCVLLVIVWWSPVALISVAIAGWAGLPWSIALGILVPIAAFSFFMLRIGRYSLEEKQCEVCGESMFPILLAMPPRSPHARPMFGSSVVRVIYDCATSGRIRCVWCGHEDGRRDESFTIKP
jgi:hypothetical protein